MKNFKYLFISILLFGFSCEKDEEDILSSESNSQIQKIEYGTSFGFCAGYCITELDLTTELILFTRYGWTDDLSYPDINCQRNDQNWQELVNSIQLDELLNSETIIGCPDCADGGSEWLEVTLLNEEKHKVTFEYGNEPDFLTASIVILRQLKVSFEDCETP